jgi:ATP-dependent DNA helicase PIF1
VLRPRINAVDPDPTVGPVTLCTHNDLADSMNAERLAAIKQDEVVWEAKDWVDNPKLQLRLDRDCIAQKRVALKVGAQVMLLKNIDQMGGLVNGSLGTVTAISGARFGVPTPTVAFTNGVVRDIGIQQWEMKRNKYVLATREQIPLRLSYAITVHKSQGMSLDKVICHLQNCFADGQAYVALSRARTLEGLFIGSITGRSIRANASALEFYRRNAA